MAKVELLAPAGDWSMLHSAIEAGADAIYFGVKGLNMRAIARNFELGELKKVVDACHKSKVRAYLTLNVIIYEDELAKVNKILAAAKAAGVDAVICWDLSVISAANKLNIPIHISTQASVSNAGAALEYAKLGAKRIVLARECSLEQIKAIHEKIRGKVELEAFCHGAMCVSQSGRCFISQFLFGKSANRGECLQPCRRRYKVTDIEEGHELELDSQSVLSPKDLCTVSFVQKLIGAGIAALKIEGRAKTAEYVSKVVSVYRQAIDTRKPAKALVRKWEKELSSAFNRGFSTGFYMGKPIKEWASKVETAREREFLGNIRKYYPRLKVAELKLVSGLRLGELVQIAGEKTPYLEQRIKSIHADLPGGTTAVDSAKNGMIVSIKVKKKVRIGDKVFRLVLTGS